MNTMCIEYSLLNPEAGFLFTSQKQLAHQLSETEIESPQDGTHTYRHNNDQGSKVGYLSPGKPDHLFQLIDDFTDIAEKSETPFFRNSMLCHQQILPGL